MPTVEIYFLAVDCSGVIVSTGRLLTESLRFAPTDQVVQVEHVQIVQGFLAVPSAEDVKVVADFVAGVGRTATGWVVLRDGGEPSHFVIFSLLRF